MWPPPICHLCCPRAVTPVLVLLLGSKQKQSIPSSVRWAFRDSKTSLCILFWYFHYQGENHQAIFTFTFVKTSSHITISSSPEPLKPNYQKKSSLESASSSKTYNEGVQGTFTTKGLEKGNLRIGSAAQRWSSNCLHHFVFFLLRRCFQGDNLSRLSWD